jgi:hypothetical protein
MNTEQKKISAQLIIISVLIIFLEYILTSVFGTTFLTIALSILALKYLKLKNYFAIKIILLILLVPIFLSCYLIISTRF